MRISKPAMAMLVLFVLSLSSSAYVTSIEAPAVIEAQNIGNLTVIELNVTPGFGGVQVNGPSVVDADTLLSAQTAAAYASGFLGLSKSNYNFNYTIVDRNVSVSGPSGGLALTLLAVAGLQRKQLAHGFTATGTISDNGTVGLVGGVYDKSGAAKARGIRYILVPSAPNQSFEDLLYYISQQEYGIPFVEVANVSQAVQYAFGSQSPSPLAINLTQGYNLSVAGVANVTCSACNTSAFSQLVNFTFNLSNSTIARISDNFTEVKQQLLDNTQSYESLEAQGYLYSAADFQFLDFTSIFTLANTQNFTAEGASQLFSNISTYCSSLVPPPLTSSNYEFVVGGRLRQYWANATLSEAQTMLNSEQSTDDIMESISRAAPALGWCKSSNELYSLAANMGSDYVQVSPSLRTKVLNAISSARNYGSNLYLDSALQAYNDGDYATALYSATYANVFPSPVPNISTSQLYSMTSQNIANSTLGIWPSQFADQAEFYFRQSLVSSGTKEKNYAEQAYTTSLLSSGLAQANAEINSSFTATANVSNVAGVSPQLQQQVNNIQQSISQIYVILLLNVVLLFAVLVVLLVHILPKKQNGSARARRR